MNAIDVRAAEDAAAAAQAEHTALLAAAARQPSLDDRTAGTLGRAQARAQALAAHATELAAALDRERASQGARDARERAAAKMISATSRDLTESRARVAAAVAAAEQAMIAAVVVVEAHDSAVRAARQAVEQAGLTGLVRPDGEPHSTTVDSGGAVRLSGIWWLPLERSEVLLWSLARVVRSQFGAHHVLNARLVGWTSMLSARLGQRSDGLLAGVPALPERQFAPLPHVPDRGAESLRVGKVSERPYLEVERERSRAAERHVARVEAAERYDAAQRA